MFLILGAKSFRIMDRDINAAENILFLLKQQLLGNQRPILFRSLA